MNWVQFGIGFTGMCLFWFNMGPLMRATQTKQLRVRLVAVGVMLATLVWTSGLVAIEGNPYQYKRLVVLGGWLLLVAGFAPRPSRGRLGRSRSQRRSS